MGVKLPAKSCPRKFVLSKKPRNAAFAYQNGLCFYCRNPMWLSDIEAFARRHSITLKQARHLQCTGEHLTPHSDGGKTDFRSIVIACKLCNIKRHQRKDPSEPKTYSAFVKRRLERAAWNSQILTTVEVIKARLPVWSRPDLCSSFLSFRTSKKYRRKTCRDLFRESFCSVNALAVKQKTDWVFKNVLL